MQEYVYYVQDDRRDAPLVRRATTHGYDEAWRLGERILRESYHHLAVEVWSQGNRLLTIRSGEAEPLPERT